VTGYSTHALQRESQSLVEAHKKAVQSYRKFGRSHCQRLTQISTVGHLRVLGLELRRVLAESLSCQQLSCDNLPHLSDKSIQALLKQSIRMIPKQSDNGFKPRRSRRLQFLRMRRFWRHSVSLIGKCGDARRTPPAPCGGADDRWGRRSGVKGSPQCHCRKHQRDDATQSGIGRAEHPI
jgi:hypothetical protein